MRGGIVMEKFYNNKMESEKLIEHIEDAKGWLDKAREYYKQANPTHAEMTLNLAQAEVKHAWELSRERYVSKKQTTIPKRQFNNLIAVAASILIFFGLVFGFQKGNINKYLAVIFKPTEKSVSVGLDSELASAKVNQKDMKAETSKTVHPSSKNLVEPVSRTAKTSQETELQASSTVAADTERERFESENIQNTVRVRQASQIAIDEDALTQEASRSLRNGK